MVNQMMPYENMEINNVFRWIESHNNWPIQEIDLLDREGFFKRLGYIEPSCEFMLLEKRFFDYRYAIRVILLGEEMIGWVVSGNGLFPALRILP